MKLFWIAACFLGGLGVVILTTIQPLIDLFYTAFGYELPLWVAQIALILSVILILISVILALFAGVYRFGFGKKFVSIIIAVVVLIFISLAIFNQKDYGGLITGKRAVIMVGDKAVHELKIGNVTFKTKENDPCTGDKPLSIFKLYECDFDIGHTNITFHAYKIEGLGAVIEIKAKQFHMFDANAKFLSFYLSQPLIAYEAIAEIGIKYEQFLNQIEKHNGIESIKIPGDSNRIFTKDLVNTKRVFIYHEDDLRPNQTNDLEELYKSKGLFLILRGLDYLNAQIVEENKKKDHNMR